MRLVIKFVVFIAFFGFNILANDIQEPCGKSLFSLNIFNLKNYSLIFADDHKPAPNSNKGYIFKVDIDGCRSSDDCNIKKGQNLLFKTLMFQACKFSWLNYFQFDLG